MQRQSVPAESGGWAGGVGLFATMGCPLCRILHKFTEILWLCPEKPDYHCSLFHPAFAATISMQLGAGCQPCMAG